MLLRATALRCSGRCKQKYTTNQRLFTMTSYIGFIITIIINYHSKLLIYAQDQESNEMEGSDNCNIPAYSSDDNYSAADRVSFDNIIYECKPPPGDVWCSRGGYEPGVGLYSYLAWNEVGSVADLCSEGKEDEDNGVNLVIGEEESDHYFCGLDWADITNDCAAAQHCPSGADDECEKPEAVCLGGTTCDASKGDGKYYEYFGLPYEDSRNSLFCGSSYTDAQSSCSVESWCKDGLCPGGSSCFGIATCNIHDIVRSDLEAEKEENGYASNSENEDGESNYSFCGLDWDSVNNECGISQHCPSGADEECELPGAKCFGGTRCDASKGHGDYFEYFKVPYHDATNRLYCAPGWIPDWISLCTLENQCRDGVCDNGMSCLQLDCNAQDLIKKILEESGDIVVDYIVLATDDPKRHNFCGMDWGDANYQCGEWCPEGNECPDDQKCFDTKCYYDEDLAPSPKPTSYQKPVSPPSRPPSQKPTPRPTPAPTPSPTHEPSPWVIQWVEMETPRPNPTRPPTQMPSNQPSQKPTNQPLPNRLPPTNIPVTAKLLTNPPTFPPLVGGDNPNKRYCGLDWTNVIENCLTAVPCPGGYALGICPRGMKCIAETPCSDESYLDWLISHQQANNGSGGQAVVESKPSPPNNSNHGGHEVAGSKPDSSTSNIGGQAAVENKPSSSNIINNNSGNQCSSNRDCQTGRMKFCHQPYPGHRGNCGECLTNGMGCSIEEVCRIDGCHSSQEVTTGVAKCYKSWELDRDCAIRLNDIYSKCNLVKMECESQKQESDIAVAQPPPVNANNKFDDVDVAMYQNPEGNSFFCGFNFSEIQPMCLKSKPCPGGFASGNCANNEGCFFVPSCRTQYESAMAVALDPSKSPTLKPTPNPSKHPTPPPSRYPTQNSSKHPTREPTKPPSRNPTPNPSKEPTQDPFSYPSKKPTMIFAPSNPVTSKQYAPTDQPGYSITPRPTRQPTLSPFLKPTQQPTSSPSSKPSQQPTLKPTAITFSPISKPTQKPATASMTGQPTVSVAAVTESPSQEKTPPKTNMMMSKSPASAPPTALAATFATPNEGLDVVEGQPFAYEVCSLCGNAGKLNWSQVKYDDKDISCGEFSWIFLSNRILEGSDQCYNFRYRYYAKCCYTKPAGDGCDLCDLGIDGRWHDILEDVIIEFDGSLLSCSDLSNEVATNFDPSSEQCINTKKEHFSDCCFEKCNLCGNSDLDSKAVVFISGKDVTCQELESKIFAEEQISSDSEFCDMSKNFYSDKCCIDSEEKPIFGECCEEVSDQRVPENSFGSASPAPTWVPTTSKPVPAFDNWYTERISSHSSTFLALAWSFWFRVYLIIILL